MGGWVGGRWRSECMRIENGASCVSLLWCVMCTVVFNLSAGE